MKKLLALILTLILAFSLVACSEDSESSDDVLHRDGDTSTSTVNSSNQSDDSSATIETVDSENTDSQDDSDSAAELLLDGEWPDNPFADMLPKPKSSWSQVSPYSTDDGFSVTLTGASVEELRAYVEELKNIGFNIDPITEDDTSAEVQVYSYSANNADGYNVQIYLIYGSCSFSVTAP